MSKHNLEGHYPSRNIWLDGKRLLPGKSQKVRNHSPDGFNWGYGGSGPSQLALAIVLKLTEKSAGYQDFKWRVISVLPQGKSFEVRFDYPSSMSPNPPSDNPPSDKEPLKIPYKEVEDLESAVVNDIDGARKDGEIDLDIASRNVIDSFCQWLEGKGIELTKEK